MSVREGFRRMEVLYWRRWWIIVIAPPLIFAYRYLDRAMPRGADPTLWFLAKPVLFAVISVFGLMMLTWIVAGFIAEPAEWEERLRK